jgi:integrase
MIRKLKPEEIDYTRSEGNGFTIRILPSGVKTWLYLYTIDGKRRKMHLGHYPDITLEAARERFEIAKKKVKNDIDPLEEKEQEADARRKAPTVAELIKEYINKHAKPSKKSWQEDERILGKDALAVWGKRKAADIKKRDVVLLLESIIDRGSPGSANNNFKIIRKMFRFAVQRDIIAHSPCDGVVMPAPLNRGDRVLSESEIKTLWQNLETCHVSDEIRRAIRLILVTAQRPGEVIGMRVNEIDGRWWTIPPERSKNGKAHRIYLADKSLELIDDTKGKDFIFLCTKPRKKLVTGGTPPVEKEPHSMWRQATTKAVKRNLAFPVMVKGKPAFDKEGKPITENKLGVADFTPHDLRRTAATFMSQLGFMDEIIDAVLNHTKQGIIRTYNLNRYDKEKQMALESWERKLLSIVSDVANAGKIINFQGRSKTK